MIGTMIRDAGIVLIACLGLGGVAGWYTHALAAKLEDQDQHLKFHDQMLQQAARLGAASRGGVSP